MRVRFVLTLLIALSAVLTAGPVGAQNPVPSPGTDAAGIQVGHPRAAVLTLFHSGAESFLLVRPTSRDEPLRPVPSGDAVRLRADYEALFLPLTAGWTRFKLAAWRLAGGERELLDEDGIEVVDFGPARRAGRLGLTLKLKPGLHQVELIATSAARAVGVTDWTTDSDSVTVWILIPNRTDPPAPLPLDPQPAVLEVQSDVRIEAQPEMVGAQQALSDPRRAELAPQQAGLKNASGTAFAAATEQNTPAQPGVDPALPLGGLYVGAQRGVAAAEAGGALNFEVGHNRTLVARVGEPVRVWTDYELWWAQDVAAAAGVRLTINRRPVPDDAGNVAPIGRDGFDVDHGLGPRLVDGHLMASFSFQQPGLYPLAARLLTTVRMGDIAFTDEDTVPFSVRVVETQPQVGAIAGLVTGEDGSALEGVKVEATDRRGHPVGEGSTNAHGRYLIEQLAPGEYLVRAVPVDLNYLDEWWPDSPSLAGAKPVAVRAGGVTSGIDFALKPGGTITGRVTNEAGEALGGIEITVGYLRTATEPRDPSQPRDPSDPDLTNAVVARTKTNDEGYYGIDRLRPNAYWVRASDPAGRYWTEYYDDKHNFGQADKVWVKAGEVTGGIDFQLAPGGAIAGVVRATTANGLLVPLPGISVQARDPGDPEHVVGSAITNREGRYRIGSLPAGRYLVRASDPSGKYLPEWFNEARSPADATPVPVEPGQTTDEIDFTLAPAAQRTVVFVDPAHSGATVGGSGKLRIMVAEVEDLGAFETEVAWNPEILQVDQVVLGDFLASTGRQVVPVEPMIDNRAGRLRYGAASLGPRPGPNGTGVLFSFTFTAKHVGESGVEIVESILTHPSAEAVDHELRHGKVTVGECMFGDFDCNCVIDIRDVMAVVKRWGTREGDPDYDPTFDLNDDGRIDIVDVQIETSLWGRRCDGVTPEPREPGLADGDQTGLAGGADPGGPDAGPRLTISADPPVGAVGTLVTVGLDVADAVDLAGFDMWLDYDPARLRFVEAELGAFLSSTGRSVIPLGPIAEGGRVGLGAFTMPGGPAPSGGGQLASLTFEVLAIGSTALEINEATTTDSWGESSPASGSSTTFDGRGEVGRPEVFLPFATARQ